MKDSIKLVKDARHDALSLQIRLGLADSVANREKGIRLVFQEPETAGERYIREAEERSELARSLSFTAFRRVTARRK